MSRLKQAGRQAIMIIIIIINFVCRGSPRGFDFCDKSRGEEDNPKDGVIQELQRREDELDRLIINAEKELRQLTEDKRFAYVTYEDLRNIPYYKNQTVMVIKAPPEAKLRVPDPSKVIEVHIRINLNNLSTSSFE